MGWNNDSKDPPRSRGEQSGMVARQLDRVVEIEHDLGAGPLAHLRQAGGGT